MRRADRRPRRHERLRQMQREQFRDRRGGRYGVDGDIVLWQGGAERSHEIDELG